MAIISEKGITLKDDVTGEVIQLSVLETGNYMLIINDKENEIKVDMFEAFIEAGKEMVL